MTVADSCSTIVRTPLPIDGLLPAIVAAADSHPAVLLRAAPGAGKTTRVPAALLDAGIGGGREILVLEPRRIAARAAAEFVAAERGGKLGDEVGYRIRWERRGGDRTRLWFLTEGVFERQLAGDPFLERVGAVVLDEFHERHLQGDLALAVVRELQASVRPDLRLVVMSATLGTDALAAALGDVAVIESSGRAFPVAMHWAAAAFDAKRLVAAVVDAVRRALATDDDGGDFLVFLPGAAEIRRVAAALGSLATTHGIDVQTLHGDHAVEAQARVLRRGPRRRIVLATNVAETALTVDGVSTVIDSGLARVARFDARHGINRLRVTAISRASADQRAGRAGRLGPGRCFRLWSRGEDAGRRPHETPEILRLDLARLVLTLRGWGLQSPASLRWLDPPPDAALAAAERLLGLLGALADDGGLSDVGRRLLSLPIEPRLGRMLLEAQQLGCAASGARLAALASERDVLASRTGGGSQQGGDSDLLLRLELLQEASRRGGHDALVRLGLDPRAAASVERAATQLAKALSLPPTASDEAGDDGLLRCVLAGFPDRVAQRREPGSARARMVGGTGAVLAATSVVRAAPYFVAVELEGGRGADALVRLASRIEPAWLVQLFPQAHRRESELVFDEARARVVRRERTCFADLVLSERVHVDVPRRDSGAVLATAIRADPARLAPSFGAAAEAWLDRLRFLATAMPELALPAADTLEAQALDAACDGCALLAELARVDWLGQLRGLVPYAQSTQVDRDAPAQFTLPTGRAATIRYPRGRAPVVAARLQELFGLTATPRLAGGRVALVFEILSPSQRPVQITDDLASFWRNGYPAVRKELRGRYPKHAWPDDPLTATPTSRARRPR